MPRAVKERDVERYLVRRVKELGGEVRKVQWIGRRGAPDRVVLLPARRLLVHVVDGGREERLGLPRTIWVEIKTPGEKPEPHQRREHERMRSMGQKVVVVDSFARVEDVLV